MPPPEARPTSADLRDIYNRINELTTALNEANKAQHAALAEIDRKVTQIAAVCGPCQERLGGIEETLHGTGDGKTGIVSRVAVVEAGRTDTLSIGSVKVLLGAIGAFLAMILGAAAGLIWKTSSNSGQ